MARKVFNSSVFLSTSKTAFKLAYTLKYLDPGTLSTTHSGGLVRENMLGISQFQLKAVSGVMYHSNFTHTTASETG